jgi:hypothetical protein
MKEKSLDKIIGVEHLGGELRARVDLRVDFVLFHSYVEL